MLYYTKKYRWALLVAVISYLVASGCNFGQKTSESAKSGEVAEVKRSSGLTGNNLLDKIKWQRIYKGNARRSSAKFIDGDNPDHTSLLLQIDTIGTSDPICTVGAFTRDVVFLEEGIEISAVLDWNRQANGCYMTAGIYIVPDIIREDPRDADDWLCVEYTGVPPGKNVRRTVAIRIHGNIRYLDRDGWPKNREGRHIEKVQIRIVFDADAFKIFENGNLIHRSKEDSQRLKKGHLCFALRSHSNYPNRAVYFREISVKRLR